MLNVCRNPSKNTMHALKVGLSIYKIVVPIYLRFGFCQGREASSGGQDEGEDRARVFMYMTLTGNTREWSCCKNWKKSCRRQITMSFILIFVAFVLSSLGFFWWFLAFFFFSVGSFFGLLFLARFCLFIESVRLCTSLFWILFFFYLLSFFLFLFFYFF
jgi:hypothetical protein